MTAQDGLHNGTIDPYPDGHESDHDVDAKDGQDENDAPEQEEITDETLNLCKRIIELHSEQIPILESISPSGLEDNMHRPQHNKKSH